MSKNKTTQSDSKTKMPMPQNKPPKIDGDNKLEIQTGDSESGGDYISQDDILKENPTKDKIHCPPGAPLPDDGKPLIQVPDDNQK